MSFSMLYFSSAALATSTASWARSSDMSMFLIMALRVAPPPPEVDTRLGWPDPFPPDVVADGSPFAAWEGSEPEALAADMIDLRSRREAGGERSA